MAKVRKKKDYLHFQSFDAFIQTDLFVFTIFEQFWVKGLAQVSNSDNLMFLRWYFTFSWWRILNSCRYFGLRLSLVFLYMCLYRQLQGKCWDKCFYRIVVPKRWHFWDFLGRKTVHLIYFYLPISSDHLQFTITNAMGDVSNLDRWIKYGYKTHPRVY